MLQNNFFYLLDFNLNEIWNYFWSHLILSMFFAMHFFFIKFFKYKLDKKNNILKNFYKKELNRTIINSIKSIFFFKKYEYIRFFFYINL